MVFPKVSDLLPGSQDRMSLEAIDGVRRRMKKLPVSSFRRFMHQKMTPMRARATRPITVPRIIASFLSLNAFFISCRSFGPSVAAGPVGVAVAETMALCVDGDVGVAMASETDCILYVVPPITTIDGQDSVATFPIEVEG